MFNTTLIKAILLFITIMTTAQSTDLRFLNTTLQKISKDINKTEVTNYINNIEYPLKKHYQGMAEFEFMNLNKNDRLYYYRYYYGECRVFSPQTVRKECLAQNINMNQCVEVYIKKIENDNNSECYQHFRETIPSVNASLIKLYKKFPQYKKQILSHYNEESQRGLKYYEKEKRMKESIQEKIAQDIRLKNSEYYYNETDGLSKEINLLKSGVFLYYSDNYKEHIRLDFGKDNKLLYEKKLCKYANLPNEDCIKLIEDITLYSPEYVTQYKTSTFKDFDYVSYVVNKFPKINEQQITIREDEIYTKDIMLVLFIAGGMFLFGMAFAFIMYILKRIEKKANLGFKLIFPLVFITVILTLGYFYLKFTNFELDRFLYTSDIKLQEREYHNGYTLKDHELIKQRLVEIAENSEDKAFIKEAKAFVNYSYPKNLKEIVANKLSDTEVSSCLENDIKKVKCVEKKYQNILNRKYVEGYSIMKLYIGRDRPACYSGVGDINENTKYFRYLSKKYPNSKQELEFSFLDNYNNCYDNRF